EASCSDQASLYRAREERGADPYPLPPDLYIDEPGCCESVAEVFVERGTATRGDPRVDGDRDPSTGRKGARHLLQIRPDRLPQLHVVRAEDPIERCIGPRQVRHEAFSEVDRAVCDGAPIAAARHVDHGLRRIDACDPAAWEPARQHPDADARAAA